MNYSRTVFVSLSALLFLGCGQDERVRPSGPTIWGVVDSGVAGSTNMAGAGSTNMAGAGTPDDAVTATLGTPCETDGDCSAGLECLGAQSYDFLGGGPPHGYCSLRCTLDSECSPYDALGRCLGVSDTVSFCIQGCQIGATLLTKCHGRPDVACQGSSGGDFCRPTCAGDEDCDGRHCDLGSGVCIDDEREGSGIGAECDPERTDECASGMCLSFSDDYAVCSGFCNLGLPMSSCGRSAAPDDRAAPSCSLGGAELAAGDLGRCNQGCSCDDDCLHPDAACWIGPFGTAADATEIYGTRGLCVAPGEQLPEGAVLAGPCGDRSDAGLLDSGLLDSGLLDGGPDAALLTDATPGARGPDAASDARAPDLDAASSPPDALDASSVDASVSDGGR